MKRSRRDTAIGAVARGRFAAARQHRGQYRSSAGARCSTVSQHFNNLIFGVLVGVSAIVAALLARTDDGSETELTAGPTAPSEAVAVRVLEVIDGDTIRVEAVGGEVLTVRLFGVDTPERGESCYDEAASRLRRLAGETVLLLADERLQDPGGRELRYVFTETGASIDAALLAEGLAVAWRLDGAFRDELVGLEEAARAAGAGCLWAS